MVTRGHRTLGWGSERGWERGWRKAPCGSSPAAGPLAISFPHNVCLLPLEDPGREGGRLGDVHGLRGPHWEEVGCGGGGAG